MSEPSPQLVIDARPQGPAGLLAEERVRGVSVLQRLLWQAAAISNQPVTIDAPAESHTYLRTLIGDIPADWYELVDGRVSDAAVTLRTDRLYDPSRLRRAIRLGRDPETAAIWRLDTPHGLAGAEHELERRQSYQPLGRYWALAPARALARALQPTGVRPNALTLAAGSLMLGAAAAVAFAPAAIGARIGIALALAVALVLDTADGHLARLQGTASEFGRWLDAYLDELVDMALHAAIAWAAYVRDGSPGWLVLGMLYAMGKYQFVVATAEPEDAGDQKSSTAQRAREGRSTEFARRASKLVRLIGHADIRWHAWIILALLGRLDAALAVYAIYFPLRALAVAVRKGVRRG